MITEEAIKKMKGLARAARLLDEYGVAQHLEKAAWAKTLTETVRELRRAMAEANKAFARAKKERTPIYHRNA
ncbi:hypothetical protein HY522_06070, partial [bacterium]|nr:hypothetical protein [bacterium]